MKTYQKPELNVKSLSSKTEFAADDIPETRISTVGTDGW